MHLTVDSVSTSAQYSPHGSSIVTLSSSPGNVVQIRDCTGVGKVWASSEGGRVMG